MEDNVTKMSALGRPIKLGDLYNYRNDCILTDQMLLGLEPSDLTSMTQTEVNFNLSLLLTEGEDNKWEHMDIDKHLQISIVTGLIENYSGASCYINDRLNPVQANQAVVLRVESRRERLDLQSLINKGLQNISADGTKIEATHIVMGVTYGAEAYCVLTKDLDGSSGAAHQEETNRELVMFATKLTRALENQRDLAGFLQQFEDEEKESLIRVKCRLYTDLQAEAFLECNFRDVYERLIYIIENTANYRDIPISFLLYPLKDIIGYSANNGQGNVPEYRDVNVDIVSRCCQLFIDLQLIRQAAEIDYSKLNTEDQSILLPYFDASREFPSLVKERLKNCVVKARSCDETDEDREIVATIDLITNLSPFKHSLLDQWVEYNIADSKIKSHHEISLLTQKFKLEEELRTNSGSKYFLVLFVPPMDEKTNLKALNFSAKCFEDFFLGSTNSAILETTLWLKKSRNIRNKICELIDHVTAMDICLTNEIKFFVAPEEDEFINKGFGYRYCLYETNNSFLPLPKGNLNRLLDAVVSRFLTSLICSGNQSTSAGSSPNINLLILWDYEELELPSSFLAQQRLEENIWLQDGELFNPASETRRTVDIKPTFGKEIRVEAVVQDRYLLRLALRNMWPELETYTLDIKNLEKFLEAVKYIAYKEEVIPIKKYKWHVSQEVCQADEDNLVYHWCLSCETTCKEPVDYFQLEARPEEDFCDDLFCQCPRYLHQNQSAAMCRKLDEVDTTFEDMKAEFVRKYSLRGIADEAEFLATCCEELVSMKAKAFNLLDQMERYIRYYYDCDEEQANRYLGRLQTKKTELKENILGNPIKSASQGACNVTEM